MRPNDTPGRLLDIERADEQILYARLLRAWTRLGTIVLLAAFAAYVAGWLPPHVALERLPALWGEPVGRFLALSGSQAGWRGVIPAGRGEMLNLLGIAMLASGPPLCLLALLPMQLRRRDGAHAVFGLVIVGLMLLAAAGLPRHAA